MRARTQRDGTPPTPLAAGGGGKRRRPAVSCGTEPAAAGHAAQRSRSRRWPQQWKPRARRDRDVRARDSLPPGDGHALGRRVTAPPQALCAEERGGRDPERQSDRPDVSASASRLRRCAVTTGGRRVGGTRDRSALLPMTACESARSRHKGSM